MHRFFRFQLFQKDFECIRQKLDVQLFNRHCDHATNMHVVNLSKCGVSKSLLTYQQGLH